MIHINRVTNQVYFGMSKPDLPDWETLSTIEEFNTIRATGWEPTEYVPPYRVSKDTILTRVLEAGKITELIALIATLSAEQQFLWNGFTWFWCNNNTVIAMCQQLELDPAVILAQDPYL
jgi:hypothetical protein